MTSVGMGCRVKVNCPFAGPGPIGRSALRGGGVFLRNPNPYLLEFQRKPRKIKRLGRQARPGI